MITGTFQVNDMTSNCPKTGMQNASLRLRRTRVIELPVDSRFGKRASKEISRQGTFLFSASRDAEGLLKQEDTMSGQVIFSSRGADLGVNR